MQPTNKGIWMSFLSEINFHNSLKQAPQEQWEQNLKYWCKV